MRVSVLATGVLVGAMLAAGPVGAEDAGAPVGSAASVAVPGRTLVASVSGLPAGLSATLKIRGPRASGPPGWSSPAGN
jgi:hypothetical protein